jgi:hypothetical protein
MVGDPCGREPARQLIAGGSAPPSKSYTTSISPPVRFTSGLGAAHLLAVTVPSAWLNSNPTCADADVEFCGMRTQARFRKTSPLTVFVDR